MTAVSRFIAELPPAAAADGPETVGIVGVFLVLVAIVLLARPA